MAEIAPFRGILYSKAAGEASKLLAPPYDVISDGERAQLEALDPHNCVRLILPQPEKGAKDDDSKYARAAVESTAPAMEGETADGVTHRLWRLTDAAAIEQVARYLEDRKIYIADGHHRYETMLALRDELLQSAPNERAPNERAASRLG